MAEKFSASFRVASIYRILLKNVDTQIALEQSAKLI
jgi:hypothetical protein